MACQSLPVALQDVKFVHGILELFYFQWHKYYLIFSSQSLDMLFLVEPTL
jgi:hypothetical protein